MSTQNLETNDMCDVDEGVEPILKKLKFTQRKFVTRAAILKIIVKENKIVLDDELEEITTDELREELPELQPRYVVYNFEHVTRDGRTTSQLCFIYYHPNGCNPEQLMRYAGCYNKMYQLSGAVKSVELVESEDLTDEWLVKQLKLP